MAPKKKPQKRITEKGAKSPNPPENIVVYRGPIKTKKEKEQISEKTICFSQIVALNTNGSGINAQVIGSNPNACDNWTSIVNIFDEFRVLGMEVAFTPDNKRSGWASTIQFPPIGSVLDHDNATALASLTGTPPTVAQYDSGMLHVSQDKWSRTIRMSEVSEAVYLNTGAPSSLMWIKLYFNGGAPSASLTLGYLFITYRIQFRGKGV